MLTEEQIKQNEEEFLRIIRTEIKREGSQIDLFIKQLQGSDFFYAPASTTYHGNFKGGLCWHELNVLKWIIKINDEVEFHNPRIKKYTMESLVLTSFGHDLSKMNFYIEAKRGVQDAETGEWRKEKYYKVKDPQDRLIFGTHGANSMIMMETFFPLNREESCAILNHMGGIGSVFPDTKDYTDIYNQYSLASMLHIADMLASTLTEKPYRD